MNHLAQERNQASEFCQSRAYDAEQARELNISLEANKEQLQQRMAELENQAMQYERMLGESNQEKERMHYQIQQE